VTRIDRIRKDEAGIGIVELIIAIAVINVAIMAMFGMFQAGALTILRAERTSNASVVAEKQMELYRGMLYAEIVLNDTLVTGADAVHTSAAEWVSAATQKTSSTCVSTAAQCKPVQTSVTGPDGRAYRVDTYIVDAAVTGGRTGKQVTVTTYLASNTSKVLAKLTSNFDLATGCIVGSANVLYKC
jgi:hypothetical protein